MSRKSGSNRPNRHHRALHRIGVEFSWTCYYCHSLVLCATCCGWDRLPYERQATRDHIVPKSRGGKGGDNLVLACRKCNEEKANNLHPMWGDPAKDWY